jgi:hypothetical protein
MRMDGQNKALAKFADHGKGGKALIKQKTEQGKHSPVDIEKQAHDVLLISNRELLPDATPLNYDDVLHLLESRAKCQLKIIWLMLHGVRLTHEDIRTSLKSKSPSARTSGVREIIGKENLYQRTVKEDGASVEEFSILPEKRQAVWQIVKPLFEKHGLI